MALFIILMFVEIFLYFTIINKKKNYKLYIIINLIIFVFISGFRNINVGADTGSYYKYFNSVITNNSFIWTANSSVEYGFALLTFILAKVFCNPTCVMFIIALLTNLCICKFIYKNSSNLFMSIFLFIALRFYFETMNTIREFLAVAVILFAFKYVKEKKFLKYLFFVFIATSIHYSAFLAILIYYLYNTKNSSNKRIKLWMIIVSGIIFVSIEPIMNTIFSIVPRYSTYEARLDSFKLFNIVNTIINVVIFIYIMICKKYTKENKNVNFATNMSLLVACYSLISIKMNIIGRGLYYFSIFNIILIPNMTALLTNNHTRKIFKMIIYLCVLALFVSISISRPEWIYVSDYSMIF